MTMKSICPKCDFKLQTPAEACPACGVIFAKYTERPRTDAGFTPTPYGATTRCDACGAGAKTAIAHFRQNIGMLFARRYSEIQGKLCRACGDKHFWSMTLITLAVGWLGTISLIIAPIYIIANVVNYVKMRSGLARVSS